MVGGAVAVAVVVAMLTLGGGIPILSSALAGAKGVAIAGVAGATSCGTLSYAGAVSLSLSESVLMGFGVGVVAYGAYKVVKTVRKTPNMEKGLEETKKLMPLGHREQRLPKGVKKTLDEVERKAFPGIVIDQEEQLEIMERLWPMP